MTICAYCQQDRPSTREHIWPRVLISKYEELITYNPIIGKFISGEPVVKDVCAECNNKRLSALDDYLGSIFEQFLGNVVEAGSSAYFEYDYDSLLRALLKVSFNSARGSNNDKMKIVHNPFVGYILEASYRPKIMLRLQIITTATMVNLDEQSSKVLQPQLLRCGVLAYDGPLCNRFAIRMVATNSFWFYIVMSYKNEPTHKWKTFLKGAENWKTPLGLPLSPNENSLRVPVNKTTYIHPELFTSWINADRA